MEYINQISITEYIEISDPAEAGFFDTEEEKDINLDLLKKVVSYSPKKVIYELSYGSSHMEYSQLFECNTLECLVIDLVDHVEPIEISKINNCLKLESLTLPIFYHDILRYIEMKKNVNGDTFQFTPESRYHQSLRNTNSIYQDWNEMIKTLSNNSTIKELNLINFCEQEWGECEISLSTKEDLYNKDISSNNRIDPSFITLGLSQILNSPKTIIQSLMFIGIDFIDSHLLLALENNKTIHSISFQYTNIPPKFNNILSVNNNIRNLALDGFDTQVNDLIGILENNSSISLYSVSIMVHKQKDLTLLLELLKNITFVNLKEFYIIILSRERSINQLKINNTIVTVSKIGYSSYKLY